jgi:hypothetical protein
MPTVGMVNALWDGGWRRREKREERRKGRSEATFWKRSFLSMLFDDSAGKSKIGGIQNVVHRPLHLSMAFSIATLPFLTSGIPGFLTQKAVQIHVMMHHRLLLTLQTRLSRVCVRGEAD